ncbi:MAG: DUF1648 domain-containing protein [Candidatus Eremiobacteraeota bacterium]|nr:DUF1648 domain-containing protein [Candidatus Eremiobacteraeota bacterium]
MWDGIAIAGFVALVAVAAHGYGTLPDRIATHWGADGTVGYGSKATLWILPALAAFALAIIRLTLSSPLAYRFNTLVRVTPQNEPSIRALTQTEMRCVSAILTTGFAGIETQIIASANGTLAPGFFFVVGAFSIVLLMAVAWYVIAVLGLAS